MTISTNMDSSKKLNGLRSLLTAPRWSSVLLVAVLAATGCASNNYPPAPSELSSAEARSYGYILGAGDTLNLYVWGYEDLSDTITVRPDGKITTKLVEDLTASGQSPSQLAREIERRYADFVKQPVVTVSVDTFVGSKSQQVRIMGAGEAPRSIPYTPDMTLLDLVIEVGGLGEFANGNGAVLVHKVDGEDTNFSLRIDDLLRDGDIGANVPLLPADIIIVPESRF